MQARLIAAAALAVLDLAAAPAFAAPPDINYLQNDLDARGRCLGTAGPSVAMLACNQSPTAAACRCCRTRAQTSFRRTASSSAVWHTRRIATTSSANGSTAADGEKATRRSAV